MGKVGCIEVIAICATGVRFLAWASTSAFGRVPSHACPLPMTGIAALATLVDLVAIVRSVSKPSVRRFWKQTFAAVFVDALICAPKIAFVAEPPPMRAGVFNR